jgi:hypothetical protein
MAALIPIRLYQQMVPEGEARFEIIEKIRAAQKEHPAEEVEQNRTGDGTKSEGT